MDVAVVDRIETRRIVASRVDQQRVHDEREVRLLLLFILACEIEMVAGDRPAMFEEERVRVIR